MEKQPRAKARAVEKPSEMEVMRERSNLEVKGRAYQVRAITLGDLMDGEALEKKQQLVVGYDADNPGMGQYVNLRFEEGRALLKEYVTKYLSCGGVEMDLGKCVEHGWDIEDVGRFLQVLYRISG